MININDAAKLINASQLSLDVMFSGAAIDSRNVKLGQLFIAIKGHKVDGHDYLNEAKHNGAACALVERKVDIDLPQLVVDDVIHAMGILAKDYRSTLSCQVVGVTGSNGKTTMKEMIYGILTSALDEHSVFKTQGNLNNHIGLPLSVLNIKAHHKIAILEMGMNHLGEIDYLSQIAKPHIAMITNAMPAHLEGLKSLDNIIQAKGEIFNGLVENGIAIINKSSEGYETWKQQLANKKLRSFAFSSDKKQFSADEDDCVQAYVKSAAADKQILNINIYGKNFEAELPVIGEHNAMNASGAICLCDALGLDNQTIIDGLKNIKLIAGRSKVTQGINGSCLIDDSYNANPGSMKAACNMLSLMPSDKKIIVIGDMAELGEEQVYWHKELGHYAKKLGLESMLAVGHLSRYCVEAFGQGAKHYESKDALIKELEQSLDCHSTVLVKGSLSMGMSVIVDAIKEKTKKVKE